MAATDVDSPAARLRRLCREQFSGQGHNIIKKHGAGYATALAQERTRLQGESKDSARAVPPVTPLSAADALLLVDELNSIISTRGLFAQSDLRGVPVEKEVERLMQRDPSDLTDQQATRVNRLVLEGLHRDSVKNLYVAGWRPMMFLYGSLGIVVAALIWWNCHTIPREHPGCNQAEIDLIAGDRPPAGKPGVTRVPLRALMTSRSMWCSCLNAWFTNIGWVFLMTWAPRYFTSVHQVSVEERAVLVSIPPLVGWIGMLSGGVITDFAVRRLGLRWGRALPISLSRFLAMSSYVACLFEPDAVTAVVLFSIVAFATDLGGASIWAFTQDVGGRNVGSVLGWGNMWGNLGAAVTPPLLIRIVGEGEHWNNAFMACAAAFALAGLFALGINATIPIGPKEDSAG